MEYYYHHDDFVTTDDDDQIGRATSCEECAQYHDRELWYWEGESISRDRLNKIHYSDHVKSQYSVILRHVTRSWIYFIKQKLQRIIQTNHFFVMNDGLNHLHTRAVLIPLIQLSVVTKLKRESDLYISCVWNSRRPEENQMRRRITSKKNIYIFVERDTDVTVKEQEDTSKKLIKKFIFRERASKLCSSNVVVTRKTDGRDRITSSRKRFLHVEEKSKRWKTTELQGIQRIRRWQFLTEWSLRYELDRSHQYIGL